MRLISERDEFELVGALEHSASKSLGKSVSEFAETSARVIVTGDFSVALKDADVVIDFALGEGIEKRIQACRDHQVAMLIGTTGLAEDKQKAIEAAGDDIAILWASNMSLGVNLVFSLAAQAAKALGFDFKINIEETHHVHKIDAPSGTALSIGQSIEDSVGKVEIEYDSYREGEVIGDHCVTFESDSEVIEIAHHAKDRSLFVNGGLKLAALLAKKDKGFYQVADLLELER